MEYLNCYDKFFKYIIKNKIVKDVDKETLLLLLQNNLKVSLFKNKVMSCKELIKSGTRKGEECGKIVKQGEKYCKTHVKKQVVEEEDDTTIEAIIIRKNEFNNFVYGKTGLIFKSSTEKYIVAREGPTGEWFSLNEEDISKCKELGLRWKKIENKVTGETSNRDVIKKYDVFPKKTDEKRTFRYLDDVLEDDKFN